MLCPFKILFILLYHVHRRFSMRSASKPNTYEFVTLLAANLRIKYQIRPQDGDFEWSKVCIEIVPEQSVEDNQSSEHIDDDKFI